MSLTLQPSEPADLIHADVYQRVVEAAPSAMLVVDRMGKIVLANPQTAQVFGYAPEELLGQPVAVLIPAVVSDGHGALREALVAQPQTRLLDGRHDLTGRSKDGVEVPIEVALTPIETAAGPCLLAVITDIGEHKRAQDGGALLAALVASSDDAIIGLSTDNTIRTWNTGAEAMFGWTRTEATGMAIALIVPPERMGEEATLLQQVNNGQSIKHFDTMRMQRDGTLRPVSMTVSPIRNGRGRVIGASKIIRDISDRKHAECALREANETLERRVAERTRELAQQMEGRRNAEAALAQAQKMEAVGQLTGGVAHDFNNLLTVISGNLYFVAEMGATNERLRRLADSMQRAVERGARLTGQLLAFARRQTLLPEVLQLNDVIRDFIMLVQRAIGESVRLEIESDRLLWPCEIDPAQFESAVLNLAINARDAMPEGGTLTIMARNVDHSGSDDLAAGRYVAIEIADTGHGMPPDVLARAVEPFFTTKEVGKGSGLGLSQVYGFVKQSGGLLSVASDPGGGTRIAMLFPAADGLAPADVEEAERIITEHRKAPVLVVEDDEDLLDLVTATLAEVGHQVIGAHDGREALVILEQHPEIALVVSDVVMPNGTSGVELGREAQRRRPGLPVLLMSGYPRDELNRLGGTATFPFLPKPFRPGQLIERLATLLPESA